MTDQQHVPHPTLADICRELGEIKQILMEMRGMSSPLPPPEGENPPPAPSQEGNIEGHGGDKAPPGPFRQTAETRQYITEIVMPKLKKIGVRSKAEAERMLYGFCLIDKFEKLTQAQAEAFYIHVQENSDDPPGLWLLKNKPTPDPSQEGNKTTP